MSGIGKAVGKVVGGITGASAAAEGAERASETQAAAAQAGIDEQRRQFDAITALMLPFIEVATGTPVPPAPPVPGAAAPATAQTSPVSAPPVPGAAAPATAPAGTGSLSGLEYFRNLLQPGSAPAPVAQAPVAQAPVAQAPVGPVQREGGSLQAQQALLGLLGPEAQQQAIDALAASPAYTSLVQQGEEALLQNASATGGLRGGNLQGALAQFRPQVLSQLIESQYGKLGGLTQLGQASAARQAAASQQQGANVANLLQQQGAATAGGQLAAGAAQQRGFSDLLSLGSLGLGAYGAFKGLPPATSGYTGAYGF